MRSTCVVSISTSGLWMSMFLCLFPIFFGTVTSEQFDAEDRTSVAVQKESFISVTCNAAGSKSLMRHPTFGTCLCKDNVIGELCDNCKPGTIDLHERHEKGCVECICSSVTKVCHLQELPLAQVRPPPEHGLVLLKISSGAEERIKNGIVTNQLTNMASYNLTKTDEEFYWELPFEFIANKITAYGRKFQWTQNYVPSSHDAFNPNLLIIGSEGTLMWTGESNITDVANETFSVQLDETSLKKVSDHVAVKADRLDVMRVLASIESIRIRACTTRTESNHINLFIANITMDVVIVDNEPLNPEWVTGTGKIEVCQCPDGYTGTSCETCDRGYFNSKARDHDPGECKKCPCNDREVDCWLKTEDYTPYCNCLVNYTGANCEDLVPSPVVIEGPSNITTQKGSFVKLSCKIANTSGTFKEWFFEPDILPPGIESNKTSQLAFPKRKRIYGTDLYKDDYALELRDVSAKNEGWYTCKIVNAIGTDERRAYLRVLSGGDKSKLHVVTEQCLRIATILLCFLFSLILIPITLLWCLKRRARRGAPVIRKRKILESRNICTTKNKEAHNSARSTDSASNNADAPTEV